MSNLPVLIIPGIMSSGLEVRQSGVGKHHIGERVWLNPVALGFGKLFSLGNSFHIKQSTVATKEIEPDKAKTEEEKEHELELECKSAWLQHISLCSDMCTEREGNEIRAIQGLDGVDFLTEIATINVGVSYVFGPIIRLLCGEGYVRGVSLDACPYDWRIPPSVLEERDCYFTNTMERIEKMYTDNYNSPVVLVCHSMGCKTGHYLLNFVLEKKGNVEGRQWIDQYVHTYMPLGAPHLGAPSLVGSAFTASLNPMLDPMLSLAERLVFARSLGSAGWLLPTTLPSVERNAPPTILCKREGRLTVEILTSLDEPLGDVNKLTANKFGSRKVKPFKIKIEYGDKNDTNRGKCKSGVAEEVGSGEEANNESSAQYFVVPSAKFVFPTPGTLSDSGALKPIRFTLRENGSIRAHDLEKAHGAVMGLRLLSREYYWRLLWNKTAQTAGQYKINLGMTMPIDNIDIVELVKCGDKGLTMTVPIIARVDLSLMGMVAKKKHRSINMKINVKWEPPPSNDGDDPSNPIAEMPVEALSSPTSIFSPIPEIKSTQKNDFANEYVPLSGQAILRAEGLGDTFVALTRDKYNREVDPVGPRDRSSAERPPVKRTFAIYGINLDTEVAKVCKRVSGYLEDDTPHEKQARPRFEIDDQTKLYEAASGGHKLEDGTLWEDYSTAQVDLLTGERIRRSGDGTVPYYSLQQAQLWAKELRDDPGAGDRVKIEEIEGAEHRAMLSDERFHKILVDYLTGKTVA
mmetsp:Transcript_6364/g.15050  ORF Transcript_6364/g.15050 Transcript_6364/m.15050 type:complete len:745 (-) Transcript_6364:627-2861(-)